MQDEMLSLRASKHDVRLNTPSAGLRKRRRSELLRKRLRVEEDAPRSREAVGLEYALLIRPRDDDYLEKLEKHTCLM